MGDFVGGALGKHLAFGDNIGAVGDRQGFAGAVVGDQHADAALGEMAHQIADIIDGDGVHPGERFVEQYE